MPCQRTVYRQVPYCVTIVINLLLASSTFIWWKPLVASTDAKYFASGQMWRRTCENDSAPQICLFRQLLSFLKSVTHLALGGSLPGFIRGNAWLRHSAGSSCGTRIPASTIALNSFLAGSLRWYGTSKHFPTFTGCTSVSFSCNLTQSSLPIFF